MQIVPPYFQKILPRIHRNTPFHARLSVNLSVRGRMPTLLQGPGCNLGEW